jgi:hypothetical protein
MERGISRFFHSDGSKMKSFAAFFEELSAEPFLATALNPRHINASTTIRRRSFYLAVTSFARFLDSLAVSLVRK